MNVRKITLFLVAFAALTLVLAACQPETVEVTRVVEQEVTRVVTETVVEEGEEVEVTRVVTEVVEVEAEPEEEAMAADVVTLNYNWGTEPPQGDPALATDTTSVRLTGNTFVGLTKLDQETAEVLPYLATAWEVGEDDQGNQTWTFTLRDDIPWVKYDVVAGEVVQDMDEEGNPRFVMPSDVEYGVKRTIDPVTGSQYAYVLYSILNAQAVNEGSEEVTLDDVGVSCDDEALTCVFTMESPAPWFPSIASMWVTFPTPAWVIEANGANWIEPGLVSSNGPYVIEKWIHGGELDLIKNPFWPEADSVQIERVDGVIIQEQSTALALYENNELDVVEDMPLPEIDRILADPQLSQEFYSAPQACTYYYGFVHTKPPMDDARVRQAFAQSIDRQALIDNVLKGGQIPATSFAPPGIFGAPEPGTVGLQYDPEAAAAALQEYLDENGMTVDDFNAMDITLMHNTSESHAQIAAAIQQMWAENLGVDVRVENQEWAVYLETLVNTTPVEEAPHIFRLGWCADYADENNWVHEVFNSDAGANRLRRNCVDANCSDATLSEFDELTYAAQLEQDPAARADLYAQAEGILAAEEVAYAPIYHYTFVQMVKPWLERTFPSVAPPAFYEWTIDWDAKLEALGQ
jgi:oligopeptide transport system substrate-binding protein